MPWGRPKKQQPPIDIPGQNKTVRTVLLHDSQELDDDLGARSDEDLSLSGLLGIVERVESVVQNGSLNHFGGCEILRSSVRKGCEVSGSRGWLAFKSHEHGECPPPMVPVGEGSARSVLERRSVSRTRLGPSR